MLSAESVQRALSPAKPYILRLSCDGSLLNGAIIERNLEHHFESSNASLKAVKRCVVVHSSSPVNFQWGADSSYRVLLFSEANAVVSLDSLFSAPYWSTDEDLFLLAIDSMLINWIAKEVDHQNRLELSPHFQLCDELLQQLAWNLIVELGQDVLPDRVYIESLTHTLITHLIRKYAVAEGRTIDGRLPPHKLARVVDYIDQHLDGVISLEAIAKVVNISPSYFLTLFKCSTGLTPHQYIMAQRIKKAKALLTHTQMPIRDIASQIGFADQSHLTRLMRRYTGLTPKILRGNLTSGK